MRHLRQSIADSTHRDDGPVVGVDFALAQRRPVVVDDPEHVQHGRLSPDLAVDARVPVADERVDVRFALDARRICRKRCVEKNLRETYRKINERVAGL